MTRICDHHPLVAERVTRLRDVNTGREEFRAVVDELSYLLIYEALADLHPTPITVRTPLADAHGVEITPSATPVIVPVLRAGLGMLNGALRLLPGADVGFVGLKRNEETFEPDSYMATIPTHMNYRPAMILDPMLATGGSIDFVGQLLQSHSAGHLHVVCILASTEGINRVYDRLPGVSITVGAVDDKLNDQAYIVPGLGDAGDRLYGDL